MAFDPEKEIEKIEEMKVQLRGHFDRSTRNNANSADLGQRAGAAESARAYAELVQAQAALSSLPKPKKTQKPYKPAQI